ncbi:phosphonoacetaldehyde hydrolase [Profundibacter amoris]|uniref:Phosphonoacetaldehyde hydrolase n=1 Tax=Profundibacter amoris TaxID=2171755 RepID=A0A347UHZ6_9RHOB|nr:phosphonoacetaldehyde hydrolase [Profundibacter amoris]AXX98474.1 phosphonoacetaldehyde hydrolase [Profundibacter amoris]
MSQFGNYTYSRTYRGKVQALVLDWSGTIADAYVIAPAVVFVEVFKNQGVEISMEEARGPMGLRKDLHIKMLTEDPVIAERWKSIKGKYPDQSDVDAMFKDFVPAQLDCLRKYTTILPGVKDVLVDLQKQGLKIGASTGFVRSMVDVLLEDCIKQGFTPDATVAGDEVINGARPAPHMVWKNLDLMNISEIKSVVKCDDTVSGVGEALNAGCWGVGLVRYSNYMNINSLDEEATLSEAEIQRRMAHTRKILLESGAHYVIDSLVDLPAVINDINARLARGEKP